ncbi:MULTISPECIES: GNAT family N-acetyltransferase [unclassified Paenibacillus]|uniref:GNAT family N-acetyltransferase n=1 Tax=unclassified Paenibacillus TaxID=185978 RepID=UPI00362F9D4E
MKRDKDVFLQGKYVALKALNESDVENSDWYDWFNDEETTKYMQKHYYPNTKAEQMDYWKNHIKGSRDRLQLGIYDTNGGPLLGCVGLYPIDYINRKAEISTIIAEKSTRNVKYFFESNKLILQHAFYSLNLYRVYGGSIVKEFAEAMCKFYGFEIEGVMRSEVYKNGKYHDTYLIGLMESEFKFRKEFVHE